MKAIPAHPHLPKQLPPLFGGIARKVARKFLAGQRLHQRHKSGMELRRVAFSFLNEEGNCAEMWVDVRKGNACFAQAASLVESNLKACPHPFRPVFQFTPDDLDLFWGKRWFLPRSVRLETQTGYGIRGDVAAIESLIHDKSKDSEIEDGGVSTNNPFSELFRRTPDHIFTGMVALHLVWGGDSGLFPPQTYGTPAGLIFEECFRAIRVCGLEEVWNPAIEGMPSPDDKPAIFLLQGQLSNITLACSCVYADPDKVFRSFSDYGARFISVFAPPVSRVGSLELASHNVSSNVPSLAKIIDPYRKESSEIEPS